jgi:hypothetical protein
VWATFRLPGRVRCYPMFSGGQFLQGCFRGWPVASTRRLFGDGIPPDGGSVFWVFSVMFVYSSCLFPQSVFVIPKCYWIICCLG